MHKVTVDGVDYFPKTDTSSKIGVAVSTYNRPEVLAKTLDKIIEFTPGAYIAVVDDASPEPAVVPDGVHLFRNEKNSGIAVTKNKSIEVLMDAGCEHLYLFDDDAFPISEDWWKPYAESPEPHLMYMFEDLSGANKLRDVKVLYDDGEHRAFTGPRGVMLYVHRSVIGVVGGMDTVYGRWGYEHGDWSNRIHHAGLTSWRFADVFGSDKLIYSLDEHEQVKRSVNNSDRQGLAKKNAAIHNDRVSGWYSAYCPYRSQRNVVITCLLTSTKDPQRGTKMNGSLDMVSKWAKSISGADPVVLVDHDVPPAQGMEVVRVPESDMNLYYRRWLLAYQYLRDHPEVDKVWITDGTDVDMLREPWHGMEEGSIYVGSEPKTLDDEWMIANHKAESFQKFLSSNYDKPMLNAGLLGGNRSDVMNYSHKIFRQWFDLESLRFWKTDSSSPEMGDMAAFNLVGYSHFSDRIVTGPRVHTVFRQEEKNNNWAWWRHK